MTKKSEIQLLEERLRTLLLQGTASTQEDICEKLNMTQSKVSRLLRKIGAIKVVNEEGHTVYSLPREPAPPTMDTPMRNLIVDVRANEALVVIFTSPGSASMVARILDYSQISTEVLGTIAGDDTIFVAPKSIKQIDTLYKEIKKVLHKNA